MTEQGAGTARTTGNFARPGKVNVRVASNISLENLQGIVARITNLTGCPTCGLLGVDLTLGGDPVEFGQIGKLPGVQNVSFGN